MKYYIGLDMGTSSLGWAVTDDKYRLLRKKGKDMWGVRLFDEADTAAARRTNRVAKRRRNREKARIGYLRSYLQQRLKRLIPAFIRGWMTANFGKRIKRYNKNLLYLRIQGIPMLIITKSIQQFFI